MRLQEMGFRVFPLDPRSKMPALKGYTAVASADSEKAKLFWRKCPILGVELQYNIGISTTRLADGRKLVVLDVDNKNGRSGDDDLLQLELEGKNLPDTYEQLTPTGGRHLVYWTAVSVGNSVRSFMPSIDTRGRGGLLVGAGSEVAAGEYTANFAPIAEAPEWLIQALAHRPAAARGPGPSAEVDQAYAKARGASFVSSLPPASAGSLSARAYEHACRLKDLGCSAYDSFELLTEWAERCTPPIADDDLIIRVENAYRHGKNKPGVAAPENAFDEVKEEPEPAPVVEEPKKLSPIGELNRDHAFIMAGQGHLILWETVGSDGKPAVRYVSEQSFHRQYLHKTMINGENKMEPVTKVWMRSEDRRSYDGLCFRPGIKTPRNWYNLWRGFSVEPVESMEAAPLEWVEAVDMFLQHARENICDGDPNLYRYLLGFLAHLVQRPFEKPMVSLVLKGKKGVGKNAFVERIGHLVGNHYTLASDARYLLGNFNSHLENCIFFVLDEAFWSGDKKAEGRLKDLITGSHHNIERKGQEPYKVENCTRVVILGNETWIVPASHDERRYAVFNVSEGRKRDNAFFRKIIRAMDAGGYRVLLRYLLDHDISDFDVNDAPNSAGLLEQKIATFELVEEWWHECLTNGEIVSLETDGWPETVAKDRLRDAYARYARHRNSRSRVPSDHAFGRAVLSMCPAVKPAHDNATNRWLYRLPTLEVARQQFSKYLGQELSWQ